MICDTHLYKRKHLRNYLNTIGTNSFHFSLHEKYVTLRDLLTHTEKKPLEILIKILIQPIK